MRTPSQPIGRFFHFGLPWRDGPNVISAGDAGGDVVGAAITLAGRILDGRGEPVPDAMLETWQCDGAGRFDAPGFRGFGRAAADRDGSYAIRTVKPGAITAPDGVVHAPHIAVSVFARGLLRRVITRIYFADEEAANQADPVLARLADSPRRASLIALPAPGGYRFDVHLHGDAETVFFELEG